MNRAHMYRSSAAEGASHIGLIIAAYDGLAEDMRLAGAAVASRAIEERCRRCQHAMQLLGHLESWLDLLDDLLLRDSLRSFYSYLRDRIMFLQGAAEPTLFEQLAMQIGETRAAWQQKQSQGAAKAPQTTPASTFPLSEDHEPRRTSWSA